MENATRALTMAGGILIALMILGALLLSFNNLSSYQNQKDSSKLASQIAEFNNQFEPYNKSNLTLMELKSVYNKIQSNNAKNDEHIETNIKEEKGSYSAVYPNIAKDFSSLPEEDKQKKVFKCVEISYKNPGGKISAMYFKKED